jgi:hypothetical protein
MGIMDKVGSGLEQAVWEIDKAFDKGKSKAGELQVEMQMDGLAKKLGYLVFDFYRGRTVDQAERQKVLDELSRLEDQLYKIRTDAKAKADANAQERAARRQQPQAGAPGATGGTQPGTPAGGPAGQGYDAAPGAGTQPTSWDQPPR